MIDTFAISKTFAREPNKKTLEMNGWKPRFNKDSKVTALILNSERGKSEPRLTLSQTPNEYWVIRAEVSLGSWLYGSNLILPDGSQLKHGLDLLSEFVEDRSEIVFDAHTERVTRVDFTHDFQVGENSVIPNLKKLSDTKISKYDRICFDETSVYFSNSGKEKTQSFKIYSKYHEMKSKKKTDCLLAKGILRLEVSIRNNAVNKLAKSLKLKNHHANHVLTEKTSNLVIQKTMKKLHFETILNSEIENYERLFEVYNTSTAFRLYGYLKLREEHGENLTEVSSLKISQKTLSRYKADCLKAGICP